MNVDDSALPSGESAGSEASAAPAGQGTLRLIRRKGQSQDVPASLVRKHDFRQSAFLAPSELRWLRLRHDHFTRSLSARMSLYLRLELSVAISKLHIIPYQQFLDTLPSPAHICMFKAEPLKGVCLLVLPARLGLSLVDRLLGGPGDVADTNRDLTEIETALLEQSIQIVLSEWCLNWQEVQEIKPVVVGHENNTRFLQGSAPETAMLSLVLDIRIGEAVEQLHLVFPYYTVEPFVRHLSPFTAPAQEVGPPQFQWNALFNEVPVPLTARCHGLKLTAREISRLQRGDFLGLAPNEAAQVEICLAGVPKFSGRLGTCGRKWAVELLAPTRT